MPEDFTFTLRIADTTLARFKAVNRIQFETPTDYPHGNAPIFYPIKMPGLGKVGNVTLQNGVIDDETALKAAVAAAKPATLYVDVPAAQEDGQPKMTWTLNNAFPTKITGTEATATSGTDLAIEELVLAYETLDVATG